MPTKNTIETDRSEQFVTDIYEKQLAMMKETPADCYLFDMIDAGIKINIRTPQSPEQINRGF